MPVMEGEYYTLPGSQTKVNRPVLGQEPVPGTEVSIDQWLF